MLKNPKVKRFIIYNLVLIVSTTIGPFTGGTDLLVGIPGLSGIAVFLFVNLIIYSYLNGHLGLLLKGRSFSSEVEFCKYAWKVNMT